MDRYLSGIKNVDQVASRMFTLRIIQIVASKGKPRTIAIHFLFLRYLRLPSRSTFRLIKVPMNERIITVQTVLVGFIYLFIYFCLTDSILLIQIIHQTFFLSLFK